MKALLTAEEMREAESYAIKQLGIPELILMEHAAAAVADAVEKRFSTLTPHARGVIVAGTGNNGGDALAVARLLFNRGCTNLLAVVLGDKKKLTSSAALQLEILGKLGVASTGKLTDEVLDAADFIIDGLFGIGLSRELKAPFSSTIETINRFAGKKWIVSIDIPSGLNADTGIPMNEAVRASETVTFGFCKRGLVTGLSADYTGEVSCAAIQIPSEMRSLKPSAFLYTQEDARRLPTRKPSGHKGDYGHVYVWAGPEDKQGAAAIAAIGALRAGSGLVTVAGPRVEGLPVEIMTTDKESFSFDVKGVVVVGPGMGTTDAAWDVLKRALSSKTPLVVDADALTLISKHPESVKLISSRKVPTVLTPHPKEAGRLLGKEAAEIQSDRYQSCRALVDKFKCAVLLKGKGTLIAAPSSPLIVVNEGDSGLSKGGTGDLLSGILASFLGQGVSPASALPLAVFVHGRASTVVSQRKGTERSTIATEIAEAIAIVFKELECTSGTLNP